MKEGNGVYKSFMSPLSGTCYCSSFTQLYVPVGKRRLQEVVLHCVRLCLTARVVFLRSPLHKVTLASSHYSSQTIQGFPDCESNSDPTRSLCLGFQVEKVFRSLVFPLLPLQLTFLGSVGFRTLRLDFNLTDLDDAAGFQSRWWSNFSNHVQLVTVRYYSA